MNMKRATAFLVLGVLFFQGMAAYAKNASEYNDDACAELRVNNLRRFEQVLERAAKNRGNRRDLEQGVI